MVERDAPGPTESCPRTSINHGVEPAAALEFHAIDYRSFRVWPPVVLAPMAGVTNAAFRRLCREYGAGLYVSEMISARGFIEEHRRTRHLSAFVDGEWPRSLQLYGTEEHSLSEATRRLVAESAVDHIDLNFGCPVRKVTAQGGGAAIPLKPRRMASLVRAVVASSGAVPVSVKFRKGLDEAHLSYRSSGRVAVEEGCVAVGLHARTAAELYSGEADWNAIADLKECVPEIPVLGNGDIWECWDALRMMRSTGCDGVIVGRGCLGRPWLFRELTQVFSGEMPDPPPALGEVTQVLRRHARALVDLFGPRQGILELRKWCGWYLKGFAGTGPSRSSLMQLSSLDELDRELGRLDPETAFPIAALRVKRGKRGQTQTVALPHGYLQDLDQKNGLEAEADVTVDGG